jgi:REP element-mobilizing transposase RayT
MHQRQFPLNRKRFTIQKRRARMVIAHHLIWTAYGTWLPNDPRGSGSHTVATPLLAELGELHFGRKQVQPAGREIREFYQHAEEQLLFDVVHFDSQQILIIAESLAKAIEELQYNCYACAVMPDHVHLVIRKHKHLAEKMIENLQQSTRLRFSKTRAIGPDHPLWTLGGWKRFLNSPQHVRQVIRYVEQNPIEIGLSPQHWSFVTPYDNWPFHKRTPS